VPQPTGWGDEGDLGSVSEEGSVGIAGLMVEEGSEGQSSNRLITSLAFHICANACQRLAADTYSTTGERAKLLCLV